MSNLPKNCDNAAKKTMSNLKKSSHNKNADYYRTMMGRFLKKHIAGDGETITHTCYGKPYKSYNIPDEDMAEFLEYYTNLYIKTDIDLHFIERPKEISQLTIDIDWKFGPKCKKRQYTHNDVKYIIECVNKIASKYINIADDELEAFIFEKDHPTLKEKEDENNNEYKDGIHVMYPNMPLTKEMRYLILDELAQDIEKNDAFKHLDYINQVDDIVDTSIVMRNGWTMYGSKKEGSQKYTLTNIYDIGGTLLKYGSDNFNRRDFSLPELLCVRRYEDDDACVFNDDCDIDMLKKKLDNVLKKYEGGHKNKKKAKNKNLQEYIELSDPYEEEATSSYSKTNNYKKASDESIKMAKRYVKLLSDKRADGYEEWLHVGFALKSVDNCLLKTWIKFSKRSNKYVDGECERIWKKCDEDGGFTIASLRYWAEQDNPVKYVEMLRELIKPLVAKAESGTHNDISKVAFELYKNNYRCADIARSIWFEFQGHKWVKIDCAYTLNMKISDELTIEFAKLVACYYTEASTVDDPQDRDVLLKKGEHINKIINKLKMVDFKNALLNECKILFYEVGFEEKLNANRDLLGFENGVYDLKNGFFRHGTPDDYISFSVGYDYRTFDKSDPAVKAVKTYFKQVQPKKEIREYVLYLISSYLDGNTKQQKFIFWTGTGSNGKSATVELCQLLMGEYCCVIPSTLLTRKRGSSSAASPEVACLYAIRLGILQEPEEGDQIQVGFMKEMTGGDVLTARRLYEAPISFKPQFKLLMTCNKLPTIPSMDGGTWRRLRVTPWECQFLDHDKKIENPETQFYKDYDLGDKMVQWKQAFMWILLSEYYPKFRKNGIVEPAKVMEHTEIYKMTSNIYLEFVNEFLDITRKPNDKQEIGDLYVTFKDWCREDHGSVKIPNKKGLKEYFVGRDFPIKGKYIMGVKYKTSECEDDDKMMNCDVDSL